MIRQATAQDASRIAEILVFNNRINYFPIFQDEMYSFAELQVVPMAEEYREKAVLANTYVYDDGIVRGMIRLDGVEVIKLYVDTFFQGRGIGAKLLEFAIENFGVNCLWALEKNEKAIRFYEKHGFRMTGEKVFEDGTTEYLVRMKQNDSVIS